MAMALTYFKLFSLISFFCSVFAAFHHALCSLFSMLLCCALLYHADSFHSCSSLHAHALYLIPNTFSDPADFRTHPLHDYILYDTLNVLQLKYVEANGMHLI